MSPNARDEVKVKRKPIARAALEQAIAEAIKTSHPQCQEFLGVIVERIAPALVGEANWAVKGVRYGRADRKLCGDVLANCVSERQLEFELSD